MKAILRRTLRSLGWDVFRYPQSCEKIDAHLAQLFARRRFDLVLDVGANLGQFGREVRRAGYPGPMVSFEPIPEVAARLKETVASDPKWVVYQYALGRSDGSLPFNVTKSTDFSSFLKPDLECGKTFSEGSLIERVIEVPVRRLDGLLFECQTVVRSSGQSILLKMDTQGFDDAVLDGAAGCLDGVTGVITEVSVRPLYTGAQRYLEAIARLEHLGFELTGLFPVNRDSELRILEFNCVMLRPTG